MKNKIVSNRMMKYLYCLTFRKLENRVLNSVEKKILKKNLFRQQIRHSPSKNNDLFCFWLAIYIENDTVREKVISTL